jgi:hypothetical protein
MVDTAYNEPVSEDEKASVLSIFAKSHLILGLLNDFYSFPKEFEEHTQTGALDMIHNGTAILMHGYGYSEEEAADILRQEISAGEKEILDEYRAWKASPIPKSDALRRYAVHRMLAFGGLVYWHSHSGRYHRENLTTTAEDRAQLVAKDPKIVRRLRGHSPPAAFSQCGAQVNNNILAAPGQNLEEANVVHGRDDRKGPLPVNGQHPDPDIFSPFKKITSEDVGIESCPSLRRPAGSYMYANLGTQVCTAPYEYTIGKGGKNTLTRFIDALQPWLRLQSEQLAIIKSISMALFNSTLMYV